MSSNEMYPFFVYIMHARDNFYLLVSATALIFFAAIEVSSEKYKKILSAFCLVFYFASLALVAYLYRSAA